MSRQLGPGDPFPKYTVSTAAGGRLNIPADLTGEYGVIIFYRGVW
jgi:peroxiredoxin